jgi:hypothetical protein
MAINELYLVVLPLVHLGTGSFRTEQVLTVLPDKKFATEFFPDEVEMYIQAFHSRANVFLTGGHVTGYGLRKEAAEGGRFIVKVMQNVE